MTRNDAKEGRDISVFEPAIDSMVDSINRLEGLVDFSELSELEQNETEQLRILCEQYLESLQEIAEQED